MDGSSILMLWAVFLVFALNVTEKTLAAGGFDRIVRRHLTPAYDGRLFFLQHGMWLGVLAAGIALAAYLDRRWAVIPVGLGFALSLEGFVLMAASLKLKEYVPGLVTSACAWPVMYVVVRNVLRTEFLEPRMAVISALLGAGLTVWSVANFLMLRLDSLDNRPTGPGSDPADPGADSAETNPTHHRQCQGHC